MVESRDLENLIKTGVWTTKGSRPSTVVDLPVRANKSSKVDRSVPRSSRIGFDGERFPPRPRVEDEAESLAKEHVSEHGGSLVSPASDEEPKCRGDLDQMPIILPVAEYNTERRFVLVSGADPAAEDEGGSRPASGASQYDANTCRKYVLVDSDGGGDSREVPRAVPREGSREIPKEVSREVPKEVLREVPRAVPREGSREIPKEVSREVPKEVSREVPKEVSRRPGLERRRSRQDLPPLETDLDSSARRQPATAHTTEKRRNRANSNVTVTQNTPQPRDSSDRREDPRQSADGLLSPIIQHATKGRERAYWDINPGASTGSLHRSPSGRERQGGYSSKNDSTSTHKRTSTVEPVKYDRHSSEREKDRNRGGYYDEPSSSRSSKKGYSPPKYSRMGSSPPRRDRQKSPSPPYPQSAMDIMPSIPGSSGRRRRSPTRDEDSYSSDDNRRSQRSDHLQVKGPRSATGHVDRTSSYMTPTQSRESFSSRPRSRAASPLPSPRIAESSQFLGLEGPSSSRSSTFPGAEKQSRRGSNRSPSPFSPVEQGVPPSRSQTGFDEGDRYSRSGRPRGSGINLPSASMPSVAPLPAGHSTSNMNSSSDRNRNGGAPPPSNSRQSTMSLGSSPPRAQWQSAPAFDPPPSTPITSYRRYSEDVRRGILPKLPECPRTVAMAGYDDWRTIPRAEGFDICPNCFEAVFAGSKFAGSFVAAYRDPARPVSCDFGSSPWYRIAYLMTLKYNYPDLRLLQGIASVAARLQACAGGRSATRVWYGIVDPASRLPIDTFPVCQCCARTIEVLLPSLSGIFVPLDSPSEPSHDVCELHFFPNRKRFIQYFDLMETANDRAVSRGCAPNIQELADGVRRISVTHGCLRSTLTPDRRWHALDALPEFTVCEECFDDVVWPLLEDIEDKDNARETSGGSSGDERKGDAGSFVRHKSFQRSQRHALASCQLYSERMRDVFRRAFRRNDLAYLERKVKERLAVEADIRARFARLQLEDQANPAVQEEIAELFRDWKIWE